MPGRTPFQFHKGTIKTNPPGSGGKTYGYFNSIKVRLKPPIVMRIFKGRLFQFHKGTIKTAKTGQMFRFIANFNSIKVRLKHVVIFVQYVRL